jgi:hypothetical protein
MLVLQSLSIAVATGAEAAPGEHDFLGNVICSSGGRQTGDLPSPRHHELDCCTLGCSMFSPLAPTPPDLAWIPATLWRETGLPSWEKHALPVPDHDYSPSNPRAPPAIA